MIEKTIFKQSIFTKTFEGDLSIIDKHVEHIVSFDKGRVVTNQGGYQSNYITFGFNDLIQSIIDGFKSIQLNANLASFWLNINKGSDYNLSHIHGMDMWSVVYYHKVCCDKSPIVFSHLVPSVNQEQHIHISKNQEIVYFPGTYPHAVLGCQQDNHQRISIAFNFSIL